MSYNPAAEAATLNEEQKPNKRRGKAAENGNPSERPTESVILGSGSVIERKPGTVNLEVPIDFCRHGFTCEWLNFKCTPRQAAAAHVLWSSLQSQHARFQVGGSSHPDGSPVEGATHGLRWLLDRLADSIEAKTGKNLTQDFGLQFRY